VYDCFISYTQPDARFARELAVFLRARRLSVFLAELSIEPGANWSQTVRAALSGSTWVLFLASRASCSSPAVQQEVGGAVFGRKKLVPIVWDMNPGELPAWAREYEALDLRAKDTAGVLADVEALARQVHSRKAVARFIAVALLATLAIALLAAADAIQHGDGSAAEPGT
jgi:hypothetical protein